MKKIERIGKRANETFKPRPAQTDFGKELNALFLEDFNRTQQAMFDAIQAEEVMQHLRDLQAGEESPGAQEINRDALICCSDSGDVTAETEINGVNYVAKIGSMSDEQIANANGDIIDWSGCTNLAGDTVVLSDNTGYLQDAPDHVTWLGDSGDRLYVGDPIHQAPPQTITTGGTGGYPQWPPPGQGLQVWPNTQQPNYSGYSYSSNTFQLKPNKNDKYAVMELPREDVPIAVFVCGRMLTLGILGTDVEVAYTGDKLVFEPGVVGALVIGDRITVSVEYYDEIYHYNIGSGGQIEYVNENSSTLETTLVSTIVKKEGTRITGAG